MSEEDKKYKIGTIRKWKRGAWLESNIGFVIAIPVAYFASRYAYPNFLVNYELMDKCFDFSAIIGSFLLTILSILLSMSNNGALSRIKESNRLWSMLLSYNRYAVVSAALFCLLSALLTAGAIDIMHNTLQIKDLYIFAFVGLGTFTLIETIQFVYVFYRIAKFEG